MLLKNAIFLTFGQSKIRELNRLTQFPKILENKNLHMKKLVLCLALATVAVSCKKIQAGGNKNIIKLEEGTERYSDDHQGGAASHNAHETATPAHAEPAHGTHETEAPKTDSTAAVKHEEPAKAEH